MFFTNSINSDSEYNSPETCRALYFNFTHDDDGLGVVKNKSGPETEKIDKNVQKIFKENKLDIVIKCNMKLVNYLDVTLNLNNSNYKPYQT